MNVLLKPLSMVGVLAVIATCVAQTPSGKRVPSLRIERGELSVTFRDNSRSPQELSGIDALFNFRRAANYDAYDPETRGASAGLNFEHIISGHHNSYNKFAPRHGRYTLHEQSAGNSVGRRRDLM